MLIFKFYNFICIYFVGQYIRKVLNFGLAILIATLSIPVVQNLLSTRQAMNTSFDSFRIVNTYGAFGRFVLNLLFFSYVEFF